MSDEAKMISYHVDEKRTEINSLQPARNTPEETKGPIVNHKYSVWDDTIKPRCMIICHTKLSKINTEN